MDGGITDWALRPAVWVLTGIVLALGELASGSMVLLPLGITAILVAAWLALQSYEILPTAVWLDSWQGVAVLYCVLAVPTVILIRRLFQNRSNRPGYQSILISRLYLPYPPATLGESRSMRIRRSLSPEADGDDSASPSASSDSMLWPPRNWSTCGRRAATPRALGLKAFHRKSGLSQIS